MDEYMKVKLYKKVKTIQDERLTTGDVCFFKTKSMLDCFS